MVNILREIHDITHYINPNPYMQKYNLTYEAYYEDRDPILMVGLCIIQILENKPWR